MATYCLNNLTAFRGRFILFLTRQRPHVRTDKWHEATVPGGIKLMATRAGGCHHLWMHNYVVRWVKPHSCSTALSSDLRPDIISVWPDGAAFRPPLRLLYPYNNNTYKWVHFTWQSGLLLHIFSQQRNETKGLQIFCVGCHPHIFFGI